MANDASHVPFSPQHSAVLAISKLLLATSFCSSAKSPDWLQVDAWLGTLAARPQHSHLDLSRLLSRSHQTHSNWLDAFLT